MPRQLWKQLRGWPVVFIFALVGVLGAVSYAAWSISQPAVTLETVAIVAPLADVQVVIDPAQQTEPDPDDDEIDLQGDVTVDDDSLSIPTLMDIPPVVPFPLDPCSNVGSGSAGPGMHVNIALGNVWTRVPVITVYGGGKRSLALTLTYNSLRSGQDRGLGFGWTHSYDAWAYDVPATADSPRKIVVVDGDGRRNAYREAENSSSYLRPPGRTERFICPTTPCLAADSFELLDPNGTRRRFESGRISEIVTARGLPIQFTYHPDGRLSLITDGYGRTIRFEYDAQNRVSKIVHPDLDPPRETTLAYENPSEPQQLTSVTDPLGNTISFDYEVTTYGQSTLHRMTRETLKNGTTYTCAYDDSAQPDMVRTISAVKDDGTEEVVLSVSTDLFPLVQAEELSYTNVYFTDGRGKQWTYERNQWGRLVRLYDPPGTDPAGWNFANYGYNPEDLNSFNRLTSTVNARGHYRYYEWNTNGDLTKVTDEEGHETRYNYNDPNFPGLVTRETRPNGAVWEYTYNDQGDVVEIKDPIIEQAEDKVISLSYQYYPIPGVVSSVTMTDRNGHVTRWDYASDGSLMLKSVQSDQGESVLSVDYDNDYLGRRTHETMHTPGGTTADSKYTAYEYDALGRLTKLIKGWGLDPDDLNLTTTYIYDGHGLLETLTNPRGIVTRFEYDHRDRRVRTIEDADVGGLNLVTHFSYDGNDNVTSVIDANGQTTAHEYNNWDHLVRSVDAEGYETLFERDATGNLLRRDRGRAPGAGGERDVVHYTYDALGRRLSEATLLHHAWLTTWFEYEQDGPPGCGCNGAGSSLPYKIHDTAGRLTYRHFDPVGRVTKIVRKVGPDNGKEPDPDDAATTYTYDPEGNVVQIDGPEGEQRLLTYDAADRVKTDTVKAAPFADLVRSYTWDGAGNVTGVTLPNGHTLTAEYDGANRLARVFDADGDLTTYSHDANDNILTQADGLGQTWTHEYDRLDRMVKAYDPLVESPDRLAEYKYDAVGNLTRSKNNNSIWTKLEYDGLNRLTKVIEDYVEAVPPTEKLVLDGLAVEDVQGTGVLLTEGDSEFVESDPSGVAVVQKLEKETSTPTQNTITTYTYDGSRQIGITDHDGNTTTYAHDGAGRLIAATYPADGGAADVVTYTYVDFYGRHVRRTDQRGVETNYHYDQLNRLVRREYDGTNVPFRSEAFTFDRSGRLTEAIRYNVFNARFTTARTYDQAGRLENETLTFRDELGQVATNYDSSFSYALDPVARTISRTMTTPAGRQVTHTYDKLNRLASASGGIDVGATWTFDQAQRRTGAALANGIASTFGYDVNDRLTLISRNGVTWPGSPSLFSEWEYGYDAVGNRLFSKNNVIPERSERYGHDNRDRLTLMERGQLNADGTAITSSLVHTTLAGDQQWADLDRRGNWLDFRQAVNRVSSKQTREANAVNEYTSNVLENITLPSYALTHDDAGNLTTDPTARSAGDGAAPSGQRYEYDEENRVVAILRDTDGTLLAEYEYDALGRRVHTIDYIDAETGAPLAAPRTTRHIHSGAETIEEYEVFSTGPGNETAELLREFVWGDSDKFPEPLALIDHTAAGTEPAEVPEVLHYLHDVLGSVVGLTDAFGTAVERYTYDPYGKTYIERWDPTAGGGTGAWVEHSASFYANPFAWTGQRYDAGVRLYSFPFRTYSPSLGRWLQRDPLGYIDGVNLYQYARDNPLFWVDPLGLTIEVVLHDKKECTEEDIKRVKELIEQIKKRRNPCNEHKGRATRFAEDLAKRTDVVVTIKVVCGRGRGNTAIAADRNKAERKKDGSRGEGSDTRIYFNPRTKGTYKDGTKRDPEAILAHELVHAWINSNGIKYRQYKDGELNKAGSKAEETFATGVENEHRRNMGIPQRKEYPGYGRVPQHPPGCKQCGNDGKKKP